MNLIKIVVLSFPAIANCKPQKVKTFNMYVPLSGNHINNELTAHCVFKIPYLSNTEHTALYLSIFELMTDAVIMQKKKKTPNLSQWKKTY
jgi:hypothetical protein